MCARSIGTAIFEAVDDGMWRGKRITRDQECACQEAALTLVGLIVPRVEIDVEQAEHFAGWFIDHVLEHGKMSPKDYVVFATYVNTAEIKDKSIYKN
jgi:hypothetical protein